MQSYLLLKNITEMYAILFPNKKSITFQIPLDELTFNSPRKNKTLLKEALYPQHETGLNHNK